MLIYYLVCFHLLCQKREEQKAEQFRKKDFIDEERRKTMERLRMYKMVSVLEPMTLTLNLPSCCLSEPLSQSQYYLSSVTTSVLSVSFVLSVTLFVLCYNRCPLCLIFLVCHICPHLSCVPHLSCLSQQLLSLIHHLSSVVICVISVSFFLSYTFVLSVSIICPLS